MPKWYRRTTLDITAASIAGNGDLLTCLTRPSIDAVELLEQKAIHYGRGTLSIRLGLTS